MHHQRHLCSIPRTEKSSTFQSEIRKACRQYGHITDNRQFGTESDILRQQSRSQCSSLKRRGRYASWNARCRKVRTHYQLQPENPDLSKRQMYVIPWSHLPSVQMQPPTSDKQQNPSGTCAAAKSKTSDCIITR